MYFDRFDIAEAYYLFASHYHGGICSKEYAYFGRLEKIGFKPGICLDYNNLSDNGKEIYNNLAKEHGGYE